MRILVTGMSRWLVTGAGGMLGQDLVTALEQRGEQVTGRGPGGPWM